MTRFFGWWGSTDEGGAAAFSAPSSPSLVRKNKSSKQQQQQQHPFFPPSSPTAAPLRPRAASADTATTPLRPRSASAGAVSYAPSPRPQRGGHRSPNTTPRNNSHGKNNHNHNHNHNKTLQQNRPRFCSREGASYYDDDDQDEDDRLPFELLFHQAQQQQRQRKTSASSSFDLGGASSDPEYGDDPDGLHHVSVVFIFTGAYVTVVMLVQIVVWLLLSFHAASWTVTNVLHLVVTLIYVHWLKGQSLLFGGTADEQGELNGLTVWEQLEAAMGRSSTSRRRSGQPPRKPSGKTAIWKRQNSYIGPPTATSLSTIQRVLFLIPTLLCYGACHFANYDPWLSAINVIMWGIAMLAKLPCMNGVRLFGINRTVGIDDDRNKFLAMPALNNNPAVDTAGSAGSMTRQTTDDDDTATQEDDEEEQEYTQSKDDYETSTRITTAQEDDERIGTKKKLA